MEEIRVDGLSFAGIHGDERRFEVIDVVNELIAKINNMNLTVRETRRVLEILKDAIETSTEHSKVEIGKIVYCEFNGRPKERP